MQNTKAFTNYYVEVVEAAEDIDEAEAEEDYEFLEQLLQSRELNALVKAHNVILFCNQEQCPCVSNACQITADVMEDIRPFALMMEECRELYALLSAPHVRVSTTLDDIQCCAIENHQDPVYVVNSHFSTRPDRCQKWYMLFFKLSMNTGSSISF